MSKDLSKLLSSDMQEPVCHGVFTHFTLPAELHDHLEASDDLSTKHPLDLTSLKKLQFPTATFFEIPWGDKITSKKQEVALEVLQVLHPYWIKWPEHETSELKWEGKDLIHVKGHLVATEVTVENISTGASDIIEWKSSEAYMLDANARMKFKGGMSRFYCLSIFHKQ
ncbi:hypothetical protein QSH57_004380 [Fusarium oxysporum f. sp. vasinfectum]|nr:hypothetical protein QSH57_004380 [Fusarium oxysporum f. sp. vasinfectum]